MRMEKTLTPDTLLDGARMYAAAADAINNKLPNSLHVLSHIIATSIELALKAYLHHNKYTEKQLRKFGHNLQELLQEACKVGFEYTGSKNFVLSVSGYNYRERLFVYPENGQMNIIMPWRLRQIANEIIIEVYSSIFGESQYDANSSQQGLFVDSSYPEDIDASNWASSNKKMYLTRKRSGKLGR